VNRRLALVALEISCLLVGLTALSGCQLLERVRDRSCPVVLVDSLQIADGLLLRARMRIEKPAEELSPSLELVAQTHSGVLTIIGFTPFGTRAFAIEQRGREVEIDDLAGSLLGIRPVWVLDALHRALWIEAPPETRGLGTRQWQWGDESVSQTDDATGATALRRFQRGSGKRPLEVSVEYAPRVDGELTASRPLRIHNPRCGYTAKLELD
jgi:hypothetical protein